MPLKCLSPCGALFSFRYSNEAWAALKAENAAQRHLRMPCCNAGVVLKRSKRGTLFFAHARRGDCTTAPESPEHLWAKEIIARAAESTGWLARTEQCGKTPSGADWIADVLCRRPDMGTSVAFEVQWSPQTIEETVARQAAYKASAVRGLWLLRQPDLPVTREIPAFRLKIDSVEGAPIVMLPSADYYGARITRAEALEPSQWSQSVPLDEFVRGALSGRLKFAPVVDACVPIQVVAAETPCWKCHKLTSLLLSLEFCFNRLFPGFGNDSIDLEDIEDGGEPALAWLKRYLPSELLATVNIGSLKQRFSRTVRDNYLSNGCIHCDAIQGRFFEHEAAFGAKRVLTVTAILESWAAKAMQSTVNRWWLRPS